MKSSQQLNNLIFQKIIQHNDQDKQATQVFNIKYKIQNSIARDKLMQIKGKVKDHKCLTFEFQNIKQILSSLKIIFSQLKLFVFKKMKQQDEFLQEYKKIIYNYSQQYQKQINIKNNKIQQLSKKNQYLEELHFDKDQKIATIQLQIENRIKYQKQILLFEFQQKSQNSMKLMQAGYINKLNALEQEIERLRKLQKSNIYLNENKQSIFDHFTQKSSTKFFNQKNQQCNLQRAISQRYFDKNLVEPFSLRRQKKAKNIQQSRRNESYTVGNNFFKQENYQFNKSSFDWSASQQAYNYHMTYNEFFEFDNIQSTASAFNHQNFVQSNHFQIDANLQFAKLGSKIGQLKDQIQKQINNLQ